MSTPAEQMSSELQQDDSQLNAATQRATQAQQKSQSLADSMAAFEQQNLPSVNARPEFNEQMPQEHFQAVMSQAPILMGLAALGGKFARVHGLGMLASTNSMMKGLVSGNQKQYEDAHQDYQQKYQQYQDKEKTWFDVYNTYMRAYRDRIDVEQLAVKAAEASVGYAVEKKQMDQSQIHQMQQFNEQLRKNSAEITHWNTEDKIRLKEASAKLANSGGGGGVSERAKEIQAALVSAGVSLPTGSRSDKAIVRVLNALAEENPDKSPKDIAQMVKSGQLGMKSESAEMSVLGKKEAAVSSGMASLTAPGGIFDQLDAAAKKINFGDAKMINQLQMAAQGKVVADKNIQAYRNLSNDAKAEMVTVLSRTGAPTDAVRKQTDEMFPANASYAEIQTAIATSKQVAEAVLNGNRRVMEAIANGRPITEAAGFIASQQGPPKEGDTLTTKSGRYAIFRAGQWVYQQ